jgi:hypothetical protein
LHNIEGEVIFVSKVAQIETEHITLLSRTALAKRLRVAPAKVRKMVARGVIPPPIPELNRFVWEHVCARLLEPVTMESEPELE